MRSRSPFFPSFHRAGLGPKPASETLKIARQVRSLDSELVAHLSLLLGQPLAALFRSSASSVKTLGAQTRRRVFTPELTFWAFLSQVLDPDSSCRSALCRVQALLRDKGREDISASTAAYCRARQRLSVRLLFRLLHLITLSAQRTAYGRTCPVGRLLVMDGTVLTTQDTLANRTAYGYANGQKKGCGFPTMKMLGLFDLRSGACLRMIRSKDKAHDATMAERMLGEFQAGDILVVDRAFCSYALIAKLRAKDVHVVCRLHQARARKHQRSPEWKATDQQQTWQRPKAAKQLRSKAARKRLSKARLRADRALQEAALRQLPAELQMRIVRHEVSVRGHRPKSYFLATTLLQVTEHSVEKIAELYLRRWEVEGYFNDMKTSQSMDLLRTHSPHMIARELLMHLIAHNMIRLLISEAESKRSAQSEGQLSYTGTLNRLSQAHVSLSVGRSQRNREESRRHLMEHIAADVVHFRQGRSEPRVLKRRQHNYQLMTLPRARLRSRPEPQNRSTHRAA